MVSLSEQLPGNKERQLLLFHQNIRAERKKNPINSRFRVFAHRGGSSPGAQLEIRGFATQSGTDRKESGRISTMGSVPKAL